MIWGLAFGFRVCHTHADTTPRVEAPGTWSASLLIGCLPPSPLPRCLEPNLFALLPFRLLHFLCSLICLLSRWIPEREKRELLTGGVLINQFLSLLLLALISPSGKLFRFEFPFTKLIPYIVKYRKSMSIIEINCKYYKSDFVIKIINI